ncbi:hypothetical protein MKK88_13640 [Methylobacterium sp. E-005]|uniref:hypothetical protein n=1 Tax=Methylobacterium sp. E-005 TaxID=2836549 RepID=UPI001FB98A29|nr:hypothetical protein [Methylobacterium sp. E-005]MCJ2087023.1 hypothetical protein [Methylobacterium sp. E-005]
MTAATPCLTRRWGRRSGMRARILALALAACPAIIGPSPGSAATGQGAASRATVEPDDPEIPARLTVGPEGRNLHLVGDLTAGVAVRLAGLLDAHPRIARLHLTSDGGLVAEGAAIGALVAARGLETQVSDACASACTLIFVRGRRRILAEGGRLGFHAPYTVAARGRMRPVDPAPERAAYRAAGLPPAFVARALSVAPAAIWIPDAAQLCAAGIVTGLVGADPGAPEPEPRPCGGRQP